MSKDDILLDSYLTKCGLRHPLLTAVHCKTHTDISSGGEMGT
jgi:hypothetical protein